MANTKAYSYTFCYYVSGHGYGHATRVCQIISQLLSSSRNHRVYIVSHAPRFIFESTIQIAPTRCVYRNALIDSTVSQPLPYVVDRQKTIQDLQSLIESREGIVESEAAWLKSVGAQCVLVDAPFIPCAAASTLNIPTCIISNFTFDMVYEWLREGDELDQTIEELVRIAVEDYKKANVLFRLPGHIPIPSFDGNWRYIKNGSNRTNLIVDVPLVVRKAVTPRHEVLRGLGIPDNLIHTKKVLLVSFGGQHMGKEALKDSLPDGWIGVVCGLKLPPNSLPANFYDAGMGAFVPDLTNAADAVLGKLGYGTCSECIAHKKPFLYVSRPQFIEEPGLLKMMKKHGRCLEMPREKFESGQWQEYIESSQEQTSAPIPLADNGDQITAHSLVSYLDLISMNVIETKTFEGKEMTSTKIAKVSDPIALSLTF
ncbi:hypothetical protein K493DRAFT_321450 [Basidiobolus meristosporus CBS 931.73]|uniref:L-arabinokinase n=1 Tax=Basidiobolus meristosporus CBS 931.73 TaxID=1314790 RepID=A0A1Y1WUX7_9FUNG|nr:hypothetical protein K493DRAFT_321450 [Basidiobolus meristosporus CBS 931.73]|eukprot:ORX77098.1 hypothetical protein K493DRAFT_321450 [Basidiobolus meristosporus CBS 931.73]